MSIISMRNVSKYFGDFQALKNVSLDVALGERVVVCGPSGSGKSTLIRCINRLEPHEAGEITVDGTILSDAPADLEKIRAIVGMVFQQFNLIPSLSVADNIAFQARLNGAHDPDWQAELIKALGIDGLEKRYPENLSGGQQQRVAIARALAAKPTLLLADEPTGNLDEAASAAVMALLLELVAKSGTTLLMVTHSAALAEKLGRIFTLRGGVLQS